MYKKIPKLLKFDYTRTTIAVYWNAFLIRFLGVFAYFIFIFDVEFTSLASVE